MKRVLITGAGSYLGKNIQNFLAQTPDQFQTETLDVRTQEWKEHSFAGFDAIVHVAGIAHQQETEANAESYYHVNRDLAVEVAAKAKAQGVSQFVLFSSMSVYGLVCGRITAQTKEAPNTHYGKSKLMAEEAIASLQDAGFRLAIVRPPMIYGKDCRGNYPRLSAMVRKLPVFPRVCNERSMLYVGCLNGFIRRLLSSGEGGLFFPQNREYVCTDDLAAEIAKAHGKRLWQPRGLGWLLGILSPHVSLIGKVFGTLTYAKAMSQVFADEPQPTFAQTIQQTEAER